MTVRHDSLHGIDTLVTGCRGIPLCSLQLLPRYPRGIHFAYGAAMRKKRNGNYNAKKVSRESVALDINDGARVSFVSLY